MQIIKNPKKEDLVEAMAILNAVFSEFPGSSEHTVDSAYEKLSKLNDSAVFLLKEDNNIAGITLGYERNKGYYHIWQLGVSKDFRKRGIATQIYEYIEDYSKENKYKGVTLNTFNRFPDNLRLAIKRGYQIVGTEPTDNQLKINLRLEFNNY